MFDIYECLCHYTSNFSGLDQSLTENIINAGLLKCEINVSVSISNYIARQALVNDKRSMESMTMFRDQ